MGQKCYFCKHDHGPRGPYATRDYPCKSCRKHDHFELNPRMPQRMALEYDMLYGEKSKTIKPDFEFDRDTALAVLKDLTAHLRAGHDIFGEPTLTISRFQFEIVRRKYLDNK